MVKDKHHLILCLGLVIITALIYWRGVDHEFINMDDAFFTIEHNVPDGLTLTNCKNAFTTFDCIWFPLTWLSHMTDVQIFGLNPGGHHLTSILMHILNVLLLFSVLRYMTGALWESATAAALFAVHPINVETVAYVAARKEMLCGLFWILGMAAYTRHTRHSGAGTFSLVLLAFALGAMTNPIIMAFPIVCFLLDFWPLHRFGEIPLTRLVMEKVPLLILATGVGMLALFTQQQAGAVPTLEMLPLSVRLANAFCAYAAYLGNLIYPSGLAIFYPYPQAFPLWQTIFAAFLLLVLTATVIYYRRQAPFLITGWGWFVLTLAPTIGIVKAGSHAMADRYAYLAFIGLFIVLAWGGAMLVRRFGVKRAHVGAAVMVVLLILGVLSFRQLGHWQSSIAVFRHALAVTSDNYTAHNNLGKALADRGDNEAARHHFESALAIEPAFPMAHNNLGVLLDAQGQRQTAIEHFTTAVKLAPNMIQPRYNLGRALLASGSLEEAAIQFREILMRQPGHLKATTRLALIYTRQEKFQHATDLFIDLLERRPAYSASIAYNLACIYAIQNDPQKAVAWLKKSIENGFSQFDLILSDPDLVNIRNTPFYKHLKKKHEGQ